MKRSTDDRGRACTIQDPAWVIVRFPDGAAARRLAARLNTRSRLRPDLLALSLGFAGGALLASAVRFLLPAHVPWLLKAAIVGALMAIGGAIGILAGRPFRLREEHRVVAAYLAEQLCPSCAYPLAGMPAAEDGCVVCPECGAAWKPSVRMPGR